LMILLSAPATAHSPGEISIALIDKPSPLPVHASWTGLLDSDLVKLS
jgi:hypothetical protein